MHPLPTLAELEAFYQSISEKKTVQWEKRLKLVERAFQHYMRDYQMITGREKPETFLDIGGGVGYYARAALNRQINTCLMDYAADALEFARSKLEISWTVCGDIQKCASFLESNLFDFVLARHTVEHMLDPNEFIRNVACILRSRGLLEIETPNVVSKEQFCHPMVSVSTYRIIRESNHSMSSFTAARYEFAKSMSGVNPPKHLWGFTAKGLSLLLERNGFEVMRVRQATAGHPVFDPLYYELNSLSSRKGLGIPYHFWERITSILMKGKGMNLAILARLIS